jgi:glycosyltransferase involved in cell wall biosynthesis
VSRGSHDMKIVQICSGYKISHNGGITNYVRALSSELAGYGHEVYVIDSSSKVANLDCYDFNVIRNCDNKLKPFHLNSSLNNSDYGKIEEILDRIKPDVIHIHMMIDLPWSILELAKKKSKVVVSLHDYSYICKRITMMNNFDELCMGSKSGENCNRCISSLETNVYSNYLLKKLNYRFKQKIIKLFPSNKNEKDFDYVRERLANVDLLVAVSSRVKEIYLNNGMYNENFVVNHIGNITADTPKNKEFTPRKKIILGFIGSFSKYKGADVILNIAEQLDKSRYQIELYGLIDDAYVSKIGMLDIISYKGKYQQHELGKILENVDLGLVLPIWEDNAPQVVFEFLNNGIPVLCSEMGGIPDFVQHDVNGLVIGNGLSNFESVVSDMNSDYFDQKLQKLTLNVKSTKTISMHNKEIMGLYENII